MTKVVISDDFIRNSCISAKRVMILWFFIKFSGKYNFSATDFYVVETTIH